MAHGHTEIEILDHIVRFSKQRIHPQIEATLLDSLVELFGTEQLAVVEMDTERPMVRRTLPDLGALAADWENLRGAESLRTFYEACTRQSADNTLPESIVDGDTMIFGIPRKSVVPSALCMTVPGLSPERRQLAGRVVSIYCNLLGLIDEKDHDRLTGLLNRYRLEEYIASRMGAVQQTGTEEGATAERRSGTSSPRNWLAVCDIDRFKSINDRFGHVYGDDVLITVSSIMRRSFRRHDSLFRYGGEEFIVLLAHTEPDGTKTALERYRHNIESHTFPGIGSVAISIGFVELTGQAPATELIGRADQALYYAKSHGRNQVADYAELISNGALNSSVETGSVELF